MASMKRLVAVLLSLSLLICLAAQAQTADTIKIGAFLSLTGATSRYGVSALNAIKLATEETNRAGGINVTRLIQDARGNQRLAGRNRQDHDRRAA
jgi:ABC-type branched-subunit amino acid transport system substrate-binding protein